MIRIDATTRNLDRRLAGGAGARLRMRELPAEVGGRSLPGGWET